MTVWAIASWMVANAEDELTLTLSARGLTLGEQRAKCTELIERLFNDNKNDEELAKLLSQLSTHPAVQLSGMRDAFGRVTKAFHACSSTYPDNWLDEYRDRMIEHGTRERIVGLESELVEEFSLEEVMA